MAQSLPMARMSAEMSKVVLNALLNQNRFIEKNVQSLLTEIIGEILLVDDKTLQKSLYHI
jgi:hypothetical protein